MITITVRCTSPRPTQSKKLLAVACGRPLLPAFTNPRTTDTYSPGHHTMQRIFISRLESLLGKAFQDTRVVCFPRDLSEAFTNSTKMTTPSERSGLTKIEVIVRERESSESLPPVCQQGQMIKATCAQGGLRKAYLLRSTTLRSKNNTPNNSRPKDKR